VLRRVGVLLVVGSVGLLAAGCGSESGSAGGSYSAAASGQAAAAKELSLRGSWSGVRQRLSSKDGYRDGPATLKVTEQRGRTFKATMTWSTPDGPMTQPLLGVFTPGGSLIAGADDEGTYSFKLINRTTLDYCYMESGETGTGYRTTCARLKKQ
jgi:hypothetical protein